MYKNKLRIVKINDNCSSVEKNHSNNIWEVLGKFHSTEFHSADKIANQVMELIKKEQVAKKR